MLIAQITDLHIKPLGKLAYGRVETAACLERAIAALNRLDPQPDLVIATGDLVDSGDPDEYDQLRRLLAPLGPPLYVVPGNHDARGPLHAAFAGDGYLPADGEFLHYTVEDWPVRLIGLDTLVPGAPSGRLCSKRLAWLAARLAEQPERPTVFFMHHPPLATGIWHMDAMGLSGTAELAQILRRYGQVERIACGHVHRSIQARFAGTLASVAPSTAHQVALDLRPAAEACFTLEPPGFHLHFWHAGAGIVTHTVNIDSFGGPYPFDDVDILASDA